MATEIADAYIALYTKMPGVKNDISKALGGPDVQNAVSGSGTTIGESLLAGMGNVAKVGALAVGGIIVGGIGTALVKGFGRLKSLDQATAKLSGLGHSAETVQGIMDNALASVKGTAFGMDEAASAAAGAVAAGVKPGLDLERTLKLVADASTIAGTDMGSMGAIFNKVAASNKVQMDVINQLHDAGVPALALLANQMGVTAEEASKMASKGEIDFATFQAAMESGLGGAALESGNTFSGAMDNMMASLGRVGANMLSGLFPEMKNGVSDLTQFFAGFEEAAKGVGTELGNFIREVGPKVADVVRGVGDAIGNTTSFIKDNMTWIGPLAVAIGAMALAYTAVSTGISLYKGVVAAAQAVQIAFNASLLANPIMLIVLAIAALVAGLIYFFTQTELGKQVWENITNAIGAAVTWLGEAFTWLWEEILQPVFQAIGEIFTWIYENIILPIVTGIMLYIGLWAALITWLWETVVVPALEAIGAVFTWLYENVIKPVIDAIGAVFTWLWETVIKPVADFIGLAIQAVGMMFDWLYANMIKPAFDAIAAAFNWVWNSIIKPVSDFIGAAIKYVGDTVRNVFGGISDFIGAAFQSVLGVVRGPINALIDLINGIIGGLNSISVDIPDWVPLVGGQRFGLSIPKIPRLAEGGIIQRRPGGIIANIGEGRYDEAVVPLSPEVLGQLGGGSSSRELVIYDVNNQLIGRMQVEADGRAAARGGQVSSAIRNRRWADA